MQRLPDVRFGRGPPPKCPPWSVLLGWGIIPLVVGAALLPPLVHLAIAHLCLSVEEGLRPHLIAHYWLVVHNVPVGACCTESRLRCWCADGQAGVRLFQVVGMAGFSPREFGGFFPVWPCF